MMLVIGRFRELRDHKISRNALWVFLGQAANFLLQAAYFVLLARLLGVKEYGVFAGAFAVVNLITPYSALGSGMLFMRYVTTDRAKAAVYWGNSLVITAVIATLIAGTLFFVGPTITNVKGYWIFVMLVLANCLFAQITNLGSLVFQTFEKMRSTAVLSLISNLARLAILVVMRLTLDHATAFQWSVGVLLASGTAACSALWWVRAEIGPASWEPELIARRVREGLGFSFAGSTQAAYNDVDKVMLSHFGFNRENGFYSLAYRVIDVATTPIAAVDAAVLPRLFRFGGTGSLDVLALAVKSAVACALLGGAMALAILLFSPLLPHLVGRDFSGVLVALHWLCWIPLLRGIHRATGSALTGSGRQNFRTAAQLTVAAVNFALNLWLIPKFGWIGAAWASVASDGLLAMLNSILLGWIWKRDLKRKAAPLVRSEVYS